MVGLENSPVIPRQWTWQGLPRSSDKEQGGLGVDRAVLQTQVRVEEKGEAFQLRTEQTVFIGLINTETGREIAQIHHKAWWWRQKCIAYNSPISPIMCEIRNVRPTQMWRHEAASTCYAQSWNTLRLQSKWITSRCVLQHSKGWGLCDYSLKFLLPNLSFSDSLTSLQSWIQKSFHLHFYWSLT